jgi:hypothetical protein
MLVYRVAYSGHTRYSPQKMVKPKGENGETPGEIRSNELDEDYQSF